MIKLLQYLLLCLFVLFLLLYFGQYSVGIEKDEVFDYIVGNYCESSLKFLFLIKIWCSWGWISWKSDSL